VLLQFDGVVVVGVVVERLHWNGFGTCVKCPTACLVAVAEVPMAHLLMISMAGTEADVMNES
jgi:hypothetical protein